MRRPFLNLEFRTKLNQERRNWGIQFCEDSSLFCFSIRYVPRVKRKKTKTEKVRFTTHCTPRSRFKNISRGGRPETPSRTRAQAFVRVRVQVLTVESNLRRPRIRIHVLCSSRNSCMTESFFGPLESKHLFWHWEIVTFQSWMKKLILPASEKRHPVAAYLAYLLSLPRCDLPWVLNISARLSSSHPSDVPITLLRVW